MANCPQCKGEMNVTATYCPHCGYDFPLAQPEKPLRRGIVYNAFADLSLVIGMFVAAIGAILALVVIGATLFDRNFRVSFFGVVAFFMQVAMYVVFQRVADMDSRN